MEPKPQNKSDPSNGYEAVATDFISQRRTIGVETVRRWARSPLPGTSILDLGCGHGVPISAALLNDGFNIYGIDAAPSLTAAFQNGSRMLTSPARRSKTLVSSIEHLTV